MKLYLIKTITNGKDLGLEYKMVYEKEDMRKSFCKEHKNDIVNPIDLINAVNTVGAIIKENRVIMPNGSIAYKFCKMISR